MNGNKPYSDENIFIKKIVKNCCNTIFEHQNCFIFLPYIGSILFQIVFMAHPTEGTFHSAGLSGRHSEFTRTQKIPGDARVSLLLQIQNPNKCCILMSR